eukprot:6983079-Pyramimonas_sp.AAC.1
MEFAVAAEHLILSGQAETVKLEEASRGAYPGAKIVPPQTPKPAAWLAEKTTLSMWTATQARSHYVEGLFAKGR